MSTTRRRLVGGMVTAAAAPLLVASAGASTPAEAAAPVPGSLPEFARGIRAPWTRATRGAGVMDFAGPGVLRSTVPADVDKAAVSATLGARSQVSVEGWWRVVQPGTNSASNVPFARMFVGTQRLADVYRSNSDGKLWLRVVKAAGGYSYLALGRSLAVGAWVHVEFIWTSDARASIVLDGKVALDGTTPVAGALAGDIDTLWIGSQEPGNAGVWEIADVYVS